MKKLKLAVILLLALFLLILTFSLSWTISNFGNIGFDGIVFTLNMPLQGTDHSLINSFLLKALLPAVGVFAEIVAIALIIKAMLRMFPQIGNWIQKAEKYSASTCVVIVILWLCILVAQTNAHFGLLDYIHSITHQSKFIEEHYVDPGTVNFVFPEKKRNLIYIFLESAETTNQDMANGGVMPVNYTPEMTELAKENFSFSQSDLLEGAAVAPLCGWTMAGMVAETAGLPLKLYKLDDSDTGVDNSMDQYASFLPGAVTIGDILQKAGYHNVFMAGSDFVFGGRKNYCTIHGNYDILDFEEAIERSVIPPDYLVFWGFEDKILYDWAKKELLDLAKQNEPFNFTMLTVDTHHPDGYLCDLCGDEYAEQYANVWACASHQLFDFVSWIQEQDFYESTTIVIAGDHCSMAADFYKDLKYEKYGGETKRKVYNVYINSAVAPIKEKNRLFTTLDLFPSTLAAMGVEIEGERLGLGVNLFSGKQTLCEEYGYEEFFSELKKKSLFYDQKLLYP